jgi:hypothetical protein
MAINHNRELLTTNRIAAAALAALGAASAIPIPLAQLDFAGLFNAFNIDSGDSPRALLIIAGVGGILTIAVVALAFAGAALALTGAPSARRILIAAALGGLVTAMPLWIPAGVVIGVAALTRPGRRRPRTDRQNASEHAAHERRNYPQPQARRGLIRVVGNRWLPLALTTGAALALWALAAAPANRASHRGV